jgi:hypothetical protein
MPKKRKKIKKRHRKRLLHKGRTLRRGNALNNLVGWRISRTRTTLNTRGLIVGQKGMISVERIISISPPMSVRFGKEEVGTTNGIMVGSVGGGQSVGFGSFMKRRYIHIR